MSEKRLVFISINPESSVSFPRIMFINVVLPQPLGPKSPYLKDDISSAYIVLFFSRVVICVAV